jgi:hydroxymethylpyrimidine pyrophosphatase-like HAD family hydrolase
MMLITRMQDTNGVTTPEDQERLFDQVRKVLPTDELMAVDNRVSIGVQNCEINKMITFHYYLKLEGIERDNIFLIGMGDGKNDEEIFRKSNLRVGFSSIVKPYVDISLLGTASHVASVFEQIKV